MNDFAEGLISGALAGLAVLGVLALFGGPVRAQETSLSLPDRPCYPADSLDLKDVKVTPLIKDTIGLGWLLLHDEHGVKPDTIVVLGEHDDEKLVCTIAISPEKQS